ncbi:hypothetical protein [Blautia sp. An81]|uniref:hypothetical protein n=1 Tax=Blautia sp. An81 TaxID=1965659 RepID=UPI000B39A302|nr:hypothetical protein [Blautia sp. An81]OUN30268.1 hypothetical protein B5G33_08780 [Blautia sp. An81]
MGTIYGESPALQVNGDGYLEDGGIAMYSADSGGGTISGGSNEDGSYDSEFRIYWTITDNGDGTYSGGVTGVSWFTETGPFLNVTNISEIWTAAQDANLVEYFGPWNNSTDSLDKLAYLNYLNEQGAGECFKLSL